MERTEFGGMPDISKEDPEKKDWVQEANDARESGEGPSDDEVVKLAEFYKSEFDEMAARRGKTSTEFWKNGAGRDLVNFSRGESVHGFSPVEMRRAFRNYLPEDFKKIVDKLIEGNSGHIGDEYDFEFGSPDEDDE